MEKYQETTAMQQAPAPQGMTLGNGDTLNTFEVRVKVPASEAIITGLVVAAGVGIVTASKWPEYAVTVSSCSFVIGFAFWWFRRHSRLENKFDKFIKLAEMRYNIDLPGGYKGGPPSPVEKRSAVVDVTEQDGPYSSTERVRVDDVDTIAKAAREIVGGAPFSAALIRDDLFTRKAWDILKEELLLRGIIIQRDPDDVRKGFEITRAGKAFWREMAK